MKQSLSERVSAWIAADPDPVTREELTELLVAGDDEALQDRFSRRLAFGTAGLRGGLGAGPNRMNRLVVGQSAVAIARFLQLRAQEAAEHDAAETGTRTGARAAIPFVLIGYDARHYSHRFAHDAAELLAGAGLRVSVLPRPLPTPVLAMAVRWQGADAGLMFTASHNPSGDNGLKVFLGGHDRGSQLVSPADTAIAALIDLVAAEDFAAHPRSTDYSVAGDEVVESYLTTTASLLGPEEAAALASLPPWVYTPLHGVGGETFLALLERLGAVLPHRVEEQFEPDPDFPTVAFPNPEELGALDAAERLAGRLGAAFIVAHDPDADRLAVSIPDDGAHERLPRHDDAAAQGAAGRSGPGRWRRLGGDELGALLAVEKARLLQQREQAGPQAVLATSLVSSPLLAEIARAHGLGYAETPTGFKWISRAPGLAYGYEEALGYLVNPEHLSDKDGISAALLLLSLVGRLHAAGRSLQDALDELDERFGRSISVQHSMRMPHTDIRAILSALRQQPPSHWLGRRILSLRDFADAAHAQPSVDILRYQLEGGIRLQLRPSGTEAKLKLYLNAGEVDQQQLLELARASEELLRSRLGPGPAPTASTAP